MIDTLPSDERTRRAEHRLSSIQVAIEPGKVTAGNVKPGRPGRGELFIVPRTVDVQALMVCVVECYPAKH
jgi:hypothetical protein